MNARWRSALLVGVVAVIQLGLVGEATAKKPIVAVFDIADEGANLDPELVGRLSGYLASSLAATGVYQVVPRDKLRGRLAAQKKDTYKSCYERSCQIRIGRELAAQKSLSTTIVKLGSKCKVTAVLYDLRKAASEGGARGSGGCSEDAIVGTLESIISSLVPKKTRLIPKVREPAVQLAPPPAKVVVPLAPVLPEPAAPKPRPFYKRWWFWGVVGAALVGGVAAVAAITGGDSWVATGADGRLGPGDFVKE